MIEKIVLGTVQLGIDYGINNSQGKPSTEQANSILDTAFLAGIRTLDTAKAYGDSIQVIGDYQAETCNDFKIISKFHISEGKEVRSEILSDLKAIGSDKFEGLLFHSFSDYQKNESAVDDLLKLKEEDKIDKIGVSVYRNSEFEKVIGDENIDIIQLPYNVLDNDNLRGDLMQYAKEMGKEIHVRSIFLQGLFFKDFKKFPKQLKPLVTYLREIKSTIDYHNVSMHQLLLMYPLMNKNIDKVLFGVDTVEQLNVNLHLLQSKFDEEIINEINDSIIVEKINLLNPVNWE